MAGPLAGVRVVELAGLGALPFATLKLADMGAEVVRVDRLDAVPEDREPRPYSSWDRGRRSIAVDLKHDDGAATVLRLAERADVFLESFRPGVAERLGVGPDAVLGVNPRLVYGRLTGWGQTGALSHAAGHSLNYEAITGVIRSVGPPGGPPVPLLNLLGDFAGGGLTLAFGVVCALWESRQSGKGQVIDTAMADGVASLASVFYGMQASGMHTTEIGENLFDGGAPFYAIYECADGGYLSVAPIEGHFWSLLLELIGVDESELPAQYDRAGWPEVKDRLAEVFATRTRDEWCALLVGRDCCVAPVLTYDEARVYPHNVDRAIFGGAEGTEVAPVPFFSRTPGQVGPSAAWIGADTDDVLSSWGFSDQEIADLRAEKVVGG